MVSSNDHIFWDVNHFTTHSSWCVSYFTLASQTRHAVASHPIWGKTPISLRRNLPHPLAPIATAMVLRSNRRLTLPLASWTVRQTD